MATKEKTKLSLMSDFPHDMATYKPYHKNIEVFDRDSENPAHRYSLKSPDEKFCVISEDEKFAFELMNGQKTLDEIAADFMEAEGKIALTMIRSLTFRLWQSGILIDPERKEISENYDSQTKDYKFPIFGIGSFASILYPFPGLIFINLYSFIILLGLGIYGTNIISQSSDNLSTAKPLFTYNNNPTYGLGILALTILAAAIIRFCCLAMAHRKHKIKIKSSGLIFSSGFMGLYLDAPGVTILKSGQRFWLRLSGMVVVFGISGVLLLLSSLPKMPTELSLLFYQVAFYMYIYLLYHCCPLINSDLYLACSDYLDEHYLRRSSVNFIQSHVKNFFTPNKSEKSDNVIYIMFCAGAALWIAGTAQLLLSAISQNSAILSGIFSKEQAASTVVLLIILILPILSGIIISSYLMYKFFINSVCSIPIFQVSRNMVALIFSIALVLLFLIKITDNSTRYTLYIILVIAAMIISISKSSVAARLQTKSVSQMQAIFMVIFSIAFIAFTLSQFISSITLLRSIAVSIMALSLLLYSVMFIKVEWSEFITSRKDSLIISLLLIAFTIGFFLLNNQLISTSTNTNDVVQFSTQEVNSTERILALMSFLVLALSFLLNIPSIVYKRSTEIFTPSFSISFALHLILYFSILILLGASKLIIWESMAAASILLLVGTESYNYVYQNSMKEIELFPLQVCENEKQSLVVGFQYIVDNIFNSISADFGASKSAYIRRNFNKYANKMKWDWEIDNIPKDNTSINTLGEIYKNSYQKIHQLTNVCCGENYTTRLLLEIDDHLHAQARNIIRSRVGELTKDLPTYTSTIMTEDKKKELITNTIFFEDIQGAQLSQLKECLHSATYSEGDLIIKQHDQGDRLYIIAEGRVQVEIEDMAGHSQVVSYIMANEFFGEISLLTASPRTASVRACEETTVIYIKKKDFDAFLGLNPEKKEKITNTLNYLRLIKSIPLFRGLDSSLINLLAGKMLKEEFLKGQTIIKQGEEGDKFYIILEGECDVHVDRDDKKNHKVATLAKGEYFGEIALIRDIPRTATITSVTETTLVLSLQKKDFVEVISSHELLASNFNDASHRRIIEMMH